MNLPGRDDLRSDLSRTLEEAGEEPSQSTVDALEIHLRLLQRWNTRYKLTSILAWEEVLARHIRESLLPLPWIGGEGRLVDIGSGNGFPGIPILVCRPRLEGTLVERSERKALFLDAVVREAGLERVQIAVRDLGRQGRSWGLTGGVEEPFDVVISRATLPPERILTLARSWSRPGGRVFLYGGSSLLGGAEASMRRLPGSALGESSHLGHDDPPDHTVGIRQLARKAIPGRQDSFLWVFEIEA